MKLNTEDKLEYLPELNVEIKDMWSYTSTTTYVFMVSTGFSLPLNVFYLGHCTSWEIANRIH
jgi:hypothetical protein